MDTGVKSALDVFLASDDFPKGVVSATKAVRSGEYYVVELFLDGSYRTAWSGHLGNKYESAGEIIQLPALDVDAGDLSEWLAAGQEEDEFLAMQFDSERADLETHLREALRSS